MQKMYKGLPGVQRTLKAAQFVFVAVAQYSYDCSAVPTSKQHNRKKESRCIEQQIKSVTFTVKRKTSLLHSTDQAQSQRADSL
jgi:hypothetical protein